MHDYLEYVIHPKYGNIRGQVHHTCIDTEYDNSEYDR